MNTDTGWLAMDPLIILVIGLTLGYIIGKWVGGRAATTTLNGREQNRYRDDELTSMVNRLSYSARSNIEEELRQNRKISAVKIFREDTGADLKDAKDAVEHMMRSDG